MSMEDVSHGLDAVKSDTTHAGENVHMGVGHTKELLGSLGAFYQGLKKSYDVIPADEDVRKLKNGTEAASNAYLEAFGILISASASTQNDSLRYAASSTEEAISSLAPPDETRFAAGQSARADIADIENSISKIRGLYAELLTLAVETFNIANLDLGGVALTAAAEGDSAITEINAYQQENIN